MPQIHDEPASPYASSDQLAQQLRAIFRALKRRLREQADLGDFTSSQKAVLIRLYRDGAATASALARAEGMRPQSMGPVIAALETAGMLRGEADPEDRRQTLLQLTDVCRDQIREGRAARQDWLTDMIAERLSPGEQDELSRAVALLSRLVEA